MALGGLTREGAAYIEVEAKRLVGELVIKELEGLREEKRVREEKERRGKGGKVRFLYYFPPFLENSVGIKIDCQVGRIESDVQLVDRNPKRKTQTSMNQ